MKHFYIETQTNGLEMYAQHRNGTTEYIIFKNCSLVINIQSTEACQNNAIGRQEL